MPNKENKSIKSGVKWSLLDQVIQQFLGFVINIILLRLLVPADFGQFVMITAFLGIFGLVKDPGLSSALVQQQSKEKDYDTVIFWLLLLINVVLLLLLLVLVKPISYFYAGDATFENVFLWLILSFYISSFSIFPRAQLLQRLNFKSLFIANVSSRLFAGILAIAAASAGWGVYSIVVQSVVADVLVTGLLWRSISWRPARSFNKKEALAKIRNYSLPLLGDNALNYLVRNVDDVLVGKLWGEQSLGVYNRAYSIMLFPVRKLAGVAAGLLFPILSSLQEDISKTKTLFLLNVQLVALVAFPLMSFVGIEAEGIVLLVLGEQWLAMAPILQILAWLGAVQSIGTLVGTIYTSQGDTQLQFKVGLFVKPMLLILIVVGACYGIKALTICYALGSTVAFFIEYYYAGRLIELSLPQLLRKLLPFFLASLGVCFTLWMMGELQLFVELPLFFELGGRLGLALFAYVLIMWVLAANELQAIYAKIKKLR